MCELCETYDFRKIGIQRINETLSITLLSNLNKSNKDNCFKYCPMCGRKLESED